MILQKTAKALDELQPGSRKLPQRARTVLLLADGKTLAQLHALLGGDHAAVAQTLVAQGYLQLENGAEVSPSAFSPPQQATAQTPQQGAAAANLSMAGTRMYLFDLCERLFANRHEMLAQSLRAQLREARDLAALRCAGLALLQAVQSHAGEERASPATRVTKRSPLSSSKHSSGLTRESAQLKTQAYGFCPPTSAARVTLNFRTSVLPEV